MYGVGEEDEVWGGGDMRGEGGERRSFVGLLSAFIVGDEGISRGRGGVVVLGRIVFAKRGSAGSHDN